MRARDEPDLPAGALPVTTALFLLTVLVAGGCWVPDQPPTEGVRAIMDDSAAFAAASTDYSAPADVDALIGIRHHPLPAGVEDLAGSVVRGSRTGSGSSWVMYSVRVGGRPALTLSRPVGSVVEQTGPGSSRVTPKHEIVDAVALPPLEPGERLSLTWCSDGGGRHVAAYVRWDPVTRGRPVPRLAWLPDVERAEWAEVDAARVACSGPR